MLKLLAGAAAGFAAAWFLDSNEGASRRNMARDKALKYFRQGKEEAVRTVGAAAGPVKGAAAKVTPGAGRPDAAERLNDPALQAKVESEAFRAASAPKDRVSVNVEDGIVYLRGELPDRQTIDRLRDEAAKVDGVRGVESLLHEPGEPAPTKDEAHHTAGTSS